jgi:cytochrome P450
MQVVDAIRERASRVRRAGSSDGLPPGPPLPEVVQLASWLYRPLPFLARCRARYGPIFSLRFPRLTIVAFTRPDEIREIFTAPTDVMHAGKANENLGPIVGTHSLLLLDGPKHLRERKLLLPPFHGARMQAYGAAIEDITHDAISRFPIGRRLELHAPMQAITLDVILRTVFGVEEGERFAALRAAIMELTNGFTAIAMVPWLQRDLGPRSPWGRFVRSRDRVDALLYAQIAERRRALERGEAHTDILSMLLAARYDDGAAMSETAIRDELMTLLAAGHETSATVLPRAFHFLATHPEAQARAADEARAALGDSSRPDPSAFQKLDYVDAVVKETMRRRPVIAGIGRILTKAHTIGELSIPSGTLVAPSIYLAHHEPESWPEPRAFDPSRFLGAQPPSPYAYLPFGGGARRCIGVAFAHYEMRIVIASVLARFRVHPMRGIDITPERRGVTIAPSHGMPVILERR